MARSSTKPCAGDTATKTREEGWVRADETGRVRAHRTRAQRPRQTMVDGEKKRFVGLVVRSASLSLRESDGPERSSTARTDERRAQPAEPAVVRRDAQHGRERRVERQRARQHEPLQEVGVARARRRARRGLLRRRVHRRSVRAAAAAARARDLELEERLAHGLRRHMAVIRRLRGGHVAISSLRDDSRERAAAVRERGRRGGFVRAFSAVRS